MAATHVAGTPSCQAPVQARPEACQRVARHDIIAGTVPTHVRFMSEPENLTIRFLRELRTEIAKIADDNRATNARLIELRDDVNVASALAMRATGERIAWTTLRQEPRALSARVAALEAERGR